MNDLNEQILFNQIHYGDTTTVKINGIDFSKEDHLIRQGFLKFCNGEFTIYNKPLFIKKGIYYDFKVYFYNNEYWQTGIGFGGNSRLFRVLKKYFSHHTNDDDNNKIEIYKNKFDPKNYAIKINSNTIIKSTLRGKGKRKNFFIDTIETNVTNLNSGELKNIASSFLKGDFYLIKKTEENEYEKLLINFFAKY